MNFDHIVLNVIDMDKSIKFYSEILQLTIEKLDEYKAGKVPFPIVRISENNIIDLFPKNMWCDDTSLDLQNHPNMNHFCLALSEPEWEDLKTRLESNNIEIEIGPIKRGGAKGDGISIYFRDPDSNLIEARYYPGNNP